MEKLAGIYLLILFSDKAFLFLIQDKDRKKGKGKNKATNNNNPEKNERRQEDQQGQAIVNTVQTVDEEKNKMRNTENVTALKPGIKKEPRKSPPRTLPPMEKKKKSVPSSKGAVPRRKITPQGPPQVC